MSILGRTTRTTRHGGGFLARTGRVLLLLVVLLLGSAGAAAAHSEVERSDPANGGMVQVGRTELTLWFGEPITESGSSFSVRGADPGVAPLETTVALEDGDTVVRLTTPPLQRGTYTIAWAVVADDGHPTRGTVVFGAGFRPDGVPGATTSGPDPLQVLVRLVDLSGTLLALGALSLTGGVARALARGGIPLRRRALGLAAAGATVSFLAGMLTPLLTVRAQVTETGGWLSSVVDILLGSTWGWLWIARLLVLSTAAAALWVAATREPVGRVAGEPALPPERARIAPAALALLAAAAGLDAAAGHASTLPARSTVAVVAATAHVLAAGVWVGGLVVVVLTVVPLIRLGADGRRTVIPELWRAFGPLAAVAAGVLVATGVYEAGRHLDSMSTVTSDPYGLAVLAKAVLVLIALGLAGYNTTLVVPAAARIAGRTVGRETRGAPGSRRLARTLVAEAAVLGCAVVAAAVMTSVPTARESQAAAAVVAPYTETIDDLFVTFEAIQVGPRTRLVVRSEGVVRPVTGPVTGVDVAVVPTDSTSASPTRLAAVQPGWYEGVTSAAPDGAWTADVVIHRDGRPDSVLEVPWSSGSASSVTPLELVASALSFVVLLGVCGGVVLWRRRSGRTFGAARSQRPDDPAEVRRIEEVHRS